jgi:hypothetical protein
MMGATTRMHCSLGLLEPALPGERKRGRIVGVESQ